MVGIGPPFAARILADLLLVSFTIATVGRTDLLLVAFAVAALSRTPLLQPLQLLIALSGRPVAERKHLAAALDTRAAGIVRPHRQDADTRTCRFAAPGQRHAKTQTHRVILRGSEPRNDPLALARRTNSCRSRGRHPRLHEGDPLLLSARIIGDLRNVVNHKKRMRKLERARHPTDGPNILISI